MRSLRLGRSWPHVWTFFTTRPTQHQQQHHSCHHAANLDGVDVLAGHKASPDVHRVAEVFPPRAPIRGSHVTRHRPRMRSAHSVPCSHWPISAHKFASFLTVRMRFAPRLGSGSVTRWRGVRREDPDPSDRHVVRGVAQGAARDALILNPTQAVEAQTVDAVQDLPFPSPVSLVGAQADGTRWGLSAAATALCRHRLAKPEVTLTQLIQDLVRGSPPWLRVCVCVCVCVKYGCTSDVRSTGSNITL